jgi:hypothetical protein
LPAEPPGRALPQPPGLVPPRRDLSRTQGNLRPQGRASQPQIGLVFPGGDLSQPPGNLQPQGRARRPQSVLVPPGAVCCALCAIGGESALRVMNVAQNLQTENNSLKKMKTDDFFILKPERIFLPELTFLTSN